MAPATSSGFIGKNASKEMLWGGRKKLRRASRSTLRVYLLKVEMILEGIKGGRGQGVWLTGFGGKKEMSPAGEKGARVTTWEIYWGLGV